MTYMILFYIVFGYLVIALNVAFYLERGMRKQLSLIEKRGELESLLLGSFTVAILWPAWVVRVIIIVVKGRC